MRSGTSAKTSTTHTARARPNRRAQRPMSFIVRDPSTLPPVALFIAERRRHSSPAGGGWAGRLARRLFFPERTHELVMQRLDQIGDHGSLAGLDEGLDRHARGQLDA